MYTFFAASTLRRNILVKHVPVPIAVKQVLQTRSSVLHAAVMALHKAIEEVVHALYESRDPNENFDTPGQAHGILHVIPPFSFFFFG